MSAKFEGTQKSVKELGSAGNVVIQQPEIHSICLEVSGTADLIQNNFSQKAIEEMLRKHMGISVQREKKVPRSCVENATIYNTSGMVCIPPVAFKKAMLTAAAQVKGLKKTQLRTQLYIEGKSIPITYEKMESRMDMVRTSGIGRTPDVRFRPSFINWKARIIIQFSHELQVQSVVDLLSRSGNVGVGEWRPEKDGTFGTFIVTRNITDAEEVSEVRDLCAVPLKPITIPAWAMDAEVDPEVLQKIAGGQDEDDESEGEEEAESKPRRKSKVA